MQNLDMEGNWLGDDDGNDEVIPLDILIENLELKRMISSGDDYSVLFYLKKLREYEIGE